MKLLRSFPLAAFALVLLSIVSFCAAKNEVGFLLVTGAIAAASWYVSEGPRGFALPRWTSNILIILASVAVVPDIMMHRHDVVGVLGRFAVFLALIKLYERKSHRDYAQLLWLSLALIVAGALASRDLLFGVALLFYTALGVYVLLLFQIHAAHERSQEDRTGTAPKGHRLIPPLRPVLGRTARGQFFGVATAAGIAGLIVSAIEFIGVPRGVGGGMLKRLLPDPDRQRTGFTSRIELTTGTRITESKTPLMRLRVLNPGGAPIDYGQPLYLRGAALETYDRANHAWSASARPGQQRGEPRMAGPAGFTPLGDFTPSSAPMPVERAYTLEFTPLVPLAEHVAFSLAVPVAISTQEERQVLYHARTGAIHLPDERPIGSYRIMADPNPTEATLRALNGSSSIAPIQDTFDDERLVAEAERLLRQARIPREPPGRYPARGDHNRRAAGVIADHLRSNYAYTLDLEQSAEDPILGFLFETRRGHCEYFASAMVALCRAADVEARLVTGFLGSEYIGDGEYVIRESNAHAWVEVRTGSFSWTTIDPTPPETFNRLITPTNTLADQVRGVYEFFEASWIDNIMGFDAAAQSDLQQTVRIDALEWINRATQAASEWLRRFVSRFGFVGGVWVVVVGAAILVVALIFINLVRRARRLRRTLRLEQVHGREYRRLLRQLGFYLDMLDLLRRGGFEKPVWQPPLAFAGSMEAKRPDLVAPVRTLTELFYAARFGGQAISAQQSNATRTSLEKIAAALSLRLR